MRFGKGKSRAGLLLAPLPVLLLVVASCGKGSVEWNWIGGPPGPLALTAASPRVTHGNTVVLTASGGLGHYQFTFDDGGAGGSLKATPDLNTATYLAPASGPAITVTVTVTSGSAQASTTVAVPATGSLDRACANRTGYASFEFCVDCEDTANAVLLRNGILDLFGASYAPSDVPTPTNRYAVRSLRASDLSTVANRWGASSGALRINPGRLLNPGNAIVGVSEGKDGVVFFGGFRASAGMLLGCLNPDGTQPSNFDGSGNTTRLISDPRYNPRGIAWNRGTDELAVPAASQPASVQDSVKIDRFGADGLSLGTPFTVSYPASGMTPETNLPYALPLADGKLLVPSASHDNGTFGVARFKKTGLLDSGWNTVGYRLMQTQVGLTPPWGPQAARIAYGAVYVAGATGSTVWLNVMNLGDGSVKRSSLSFAGTGHVVGAVLPQPDGGAIVVGNATQTVKNGFLVRFRPSTGSDGLEPDTNAFPGGFAQLADALDGAITDPYSFEAGEIDAEGRILAVGWRQRSGRKSMFAACFHP